MEYVLVFESGIGSQHGHIGLSRQLVLFIIVLDHRPDYSLNVMERRVSDVELLEETLEAVVNKVFIDIL